MSTEVLPEYAAQIQALASQIKEQSAAVQELSAAVQALGLIIATEREENARLLQLVHDLGGDPTASHPLH